MAYSILHDRSRRVVVYQRQALTSCYNSDPNIFVTIFVTIRTFDTKILQRYQEHWYSV